MNRTSILLIFLATVLFSCTDETTSVSGTQWINMDSLINAQMTSKATIEKSAMLDNQRSEGKVSVNTNWSSELEAFSRLAVMNKPIYRNQYSKSSGPDPYSNLILKKIVATDSLAPVKELRISVLPDSHQIVRLEGILKETSLLYSKDEQLIMEFDPHTGRLERYSVTGKQKLAWFKPDQYDIKASVIYR